MITGPFIDISVTHSKQLPVWPGGYGFNIYALQKIEDGFDANVTRLDFDVHTGTHIDAPLHFIHNGLTTNDIELEILIGKAIVIAFNGEVVSLVDLEQKNIPSGTRRILLKTHNSASGWFKNPFNVSYVAIDSSAAKWLVNRGVQLIGIDGPSIQKYTDSKDTHVTLLENNVVILEGLNLDGVNEGEYELICLPVKADGCEGVPARAILKEINN